MKFKTILADPPWQFEVWADHAVATRRNGLFPPRDQWTFIGNEVTGNDIRVDLEALAAQQG